MRNWGNKAKNVSAVIWSKQSNKKMSKTGKKNLGKNGR